MIYKKFILDSFKLLDEGDRSGFFDKLSEDVTWEINRSHLNAGKPAVTGSINSFYPASAEINHTFLNVWEVDDTYIITADLFMKISQSSTEVPWTAIVKIHDGKISRIEIYSDSTDTI